MAVTEETNEIMDVALVLTTFLRHGIYRFKFEAITESMSYGLLANLKRETFGRWMRNPFYQYIPNLKAWQFKYGKRTSMMGKVIPNSFGLEDAILNLGYENFVRWLRIWSSNYADGAESDQQATQRLEDEIGRIYAVSRAKSLAEGRQAAVKDATILLKDVWRTACEIKGRPDYMTMPIGTGRKTTVYISRNTRNANRGTYIGGNTDIVEEV